jgi:hypothetical protein
MYDLYFKWNIYMLFLVVMGEYTFIYIILLYLLVTQYNLIHYVLAA